MLSHLREPGNALTHLLGVLLSAAGLPVLIYRAMVHGTAWHVVSFAVFGVSMILLYTASTIYHALRVGPGALARLRKVDHMAIFILIAGTYTPFTLIPLRGVWGWSLFGAIWGIALVGIAVKLFWMGAPRWVSAGTYVLMGWLVVVAASPLARSITPAVGIALATGGIVYTLGAVVYACKWPNPLPGRFGFHELWHLFVLGGSAAHFSAVFLLL